MEKEGSEWVGTLCISGVGLEGGSRRPPWSWGLLVPVCTARHVCTACSTPRGTTGFGAGVPRGHPSQRRVKPLRPGAATQRLALILENKCNIRPEYIIYLISNETNKVGQLRAWPVFRMNLGGH